MRTNGLANAIREELLGMDGVKKLSVTRRGTAVFSVGTPANHLYYLESGLVKVKRTTKANRDIVLSVVCSGELFGEQALLGEGFFSVAAKTLEAAVVYSLPTEVF